MASETKLEDSNLAFYGSDEHKRLRLEAAKTASEWDGCGGSPGIEVWRIEDFAVKRWSKERYGEFYSGDSYIVLRTYKSEEGDKLLYDAHFWLGESSTQDEYGTAAYKTVELDDLLGGLPVQHREVQNHESELFKSYFQPSIVTLEGGVDSGFRHVEEEEYPVKLFWVKGKGRKVGVRQVPEASASSLNHGDVFILDTAAAVYQWNGSESGVWEKSKASQVVNQIREKRAGSASQVVIDDGDDGEDVDAFFALLGGSASDVADAAAGGDDSDLSSFEKTLFRLSDGEGAGELSFKAVATGDAVKQDLLESDDVFVLDTGEDAGIFVWVGKGASKSEQGGAMARAMSYLESSSRPKHTHITRVVEGGETADFLSAVAASA